MANTGFALGIGMLLYTIHLVGESRGGFSRVLYLSLVILVSLNQAVSDVSYTWGFFHKNALLSYDVLTIVFVFQKNILS